MKQKDNFFNINDLSKGISRTLTKGLKASIFPGEQAMVSVVTIDPNSIVPNHTHPHEQAGILIEGELEMIIGDESKLLKPGDMYIVPGNIEHYATATDKGAKVIDIFAPVRDEFKY